MNKLSCSVKRILVSKLIFMAAVLTSCVPVCVHGAEGKRNVFLVPVSAETSWQEFAYLAVVPAATRVNNGTPAVVAMNDFGSINREIRHYLSLYKPNKVYIVGKGLQCAGNWLVGGKSDSSEVKGVAGTACRTVSAWVKLEEGAGGGEVISWGRQGAGKKWTVLVNKKGRILVDVGEARITGTTDLRDGKEHHIMAVLEKTSAGEKTTTNSINLYINGVKEMIGQSMDKAASPLRNLLTGYWQMDEGHGSTVQDSTVYNQTGTLEWRITPAGFCDGKFGTAVQLNGIGNSIVTDIFRQKHADGTVKAFSTSFWVRPDSNNGIVIGTWGICGNNKGGWLLKLKNNGKITAAFDCLKKGEEYRGWDSVVRTEVSPDSNDSKKMLVGGGKWHHVVLVYDGKRARLYLDGEKQADKEIAGVGVTTFFPLQIGAKNWHGTNSEFFKGAIDEVALWQRAITGEEAAKLYNGGNGRQIDLSSTLVDTAATRIKVAKNSFDGKMKEVLFFDRALQKQDAMAMANKWLDYPGALKIPGDSAEQLANKLARKFWKSSDKALLCKTGVKGYKAYQSALAASALAGRLQIPLLFMNGKVISEKTGATIAKLGIKNIITVGLKETPELAGIKVSNLKNALEVIKYLEKNGKKVDYFAVCNPRDRSTTVVHKGSLAAPLLAAGREGAVVPLPYKTIFKRYFHSNSDKIITQRPKGIEIEPTKTNIHFELNEGKPNVEGCEAYPVDGKFGWGNIQHKRYCVAASSANQKQFDLLLVDINGDGKYNSQDILKVGSVISLKGKTPRPTSCFKLLAINGQRKYATIELNAWPTGTCEFDGKEYQYLLYCTHGDYWNVAYIDLNGNGSFGDPGEGPFERADIVKIGKRNYSLTIGGVQTKGDFRYTYPTYQQMRRDFRKYYDALGRHPEFMCIVGMPDTVPFAILDGQAYQDAEDVPSDFPYGDVDDDPFIEIAIGRMVALNSTFMTLQASRCLTYNDLVGDPDVWATRQLWTGGFSNNRHMADLKLRNIGYKPAVIHLEDYDTTDVSHFGVIVQDDHGSSGGFGGGFGAGMKELLAPCIFEVGGCNTGGIDKDVIDNLCVPHLLRAGAVAYIGTMRGTPGCKQHYRRSIWNSVAQAATVGQAHRRGLNLLFTRMRNELGGRMSGPAENYKKNRGYMWYDACSEQFYGDPALRLYRPHEPTDRPVYLEEKNNGKLLRLHGPDKYWLDYEYTHKDELLKTSEAEKGQKNVMYTAPGLTGPHFEQRSFVEWRTDNKEVKGIKHISKAAKPLGMQGFSYVDYHQDGTRSIYWMVRLEEFSKAGKQIKQKLDYLDFEPVTE